MLGVVCHHSQLGLKQVLPGRPYQGDNALLQHPEAGVALQRPAQPPTGTLEQHHHIWCRSGTPRIAHSDQAPHMGRAAASPHAIAAALRRATAWSHVCTL